MFSRGAVPARSLRSRRCRVAPRTSSDGGCAPWPPSRSARSLDWDCGLPHGSMFFWRSTARFRGRDHGAGGAGMDAARSKLRQVEPAQGGNLHREPHSSAGNRKSTFFVPSHYSGWILMILEASPMFCQIRALATAVLLLAKHAVLYGFTSW